MKKKKPFILFFLLFFLIDFKITIPEINQTYKIFNGYKDYSWETNIDDIFEVNSENLINSTNLNTYFSINNPQYVFENVLSDKIILGFLDNKLQTVQIFYEGKNNFNILYNFILNKLKTKPTVVTINNEWEATSWCDNDLESYVVIYSGKDKNTNILSFASKKSVDKELDYNKQIGLPTSICYNQKNIERE